MSLESTAQSMQTRIPVSRDLEELRMEKIHFNLTVLKLSPKKAREWADRTVKIVEEAELEEAEFASKSA
jgi:hypothetical protein